MVWKETIRNMKYEIRTKSYNVILDPCKLNIPSKYGDRESHYNL